MDNILCELWYGNVSPFEEFYPNTREMQKLSEQIACDYDRLMDRMTDDDKKALERYSDNVLKLENLSNEALFAYAFSLGLRLAVESLMGRWHRGR